MRRRKKNDEAKRDDRDGTRSESDLEQRCRGAKRGRHERCRSEVRPECGAGRHGGSPDGAIGGEERFEREQLAASKGITLPSALDRKHQRTVNRLSHVTAQSFD